MWAENWVVSCECACSPGGCRGSADPSEEHAHHQSFLLPPGWSDYAWQKGSCFVSEIRTLCNVATWQSYLSWTENCMGCLIVSLLLFPDFFLHNSLYFSVCLSVCLLFSLFLSLVFIQSFIKSLKGVCLKFLAFHCKVLQCINQKRIFSYRYSRQEARGSREPPSKPFSSVSLLPTDVCQAVCRWKLGPNGPNL